MVEYGTIRVPRDVFERVNETRKEQGMTWATWLKQASEGAPPDDSTAPGDAVVTDAELEQRVRELVEETTDSGLSEADVRRVVRDEIDQLRTR